MKKLVGVLATSLLLNACGAGVDADTAQSVEEPVQAATQEVKASAPALSGMATLGLCQELQEVLGIARDPGALPRVDLTGTVTCFTGYGVDGFALWGDVSAGLFTDATGPISVRAFNETVAAMSVSIFGKPADVLFAKMSKTWSVNQPETVKVSKTGLVRCEELNGHASCALRSFVSFSGRSQ